MPCGLVVEFSVVRSYRLNKVKEGLCSHLAKTAATSLRLSRRRPQLYTFGASHDVSIPIYHRQGWKRMDAEYSKSER
jgi:hypothetical protein